VAKTTFLQPGIMIRREIITLVHPLTLRLLLLTNMETSLTNQ